MNQGWCHQDRLLTFLFIPAAFYSTGTLIFVHIFLKIIDVFLFVQLPCLVLFSLFRAVFAYFLIVLASILSPISSYTRKRTDYCVFVSILHLWTQLYIFVLPDPFRQFSLKWSNFFIKKNELFLKKNLSLSFLLYS